MTLSFKTVKIIIAALLFVFLTTTLFSATLFMPVQKASAQVPGAPSIVIAPKSDALATAHRIINEFKVEARSLRDRGWKLFDQAKAELRQAIKENYKAFLAGLAIKLTTNIIGLVLRRLVEKNKIDDYRKVYQFLTKYIYALQYIDEQYQNGNYNFEDAHILRLLIFGMGSDWATARSPNLGDLSVLDSNPEFYQWIQAKVNDKKVCQTGRLNPADPNYYQWLLESKGPECMVPFVAAGFTDKAISIISDAQFAAQMEIAAGEGYQSQRQCGNLYVNQDREFARVQTGATTLAGREVPLYQFGNVPTGTYSIDVLKTGFSLVCSAITQPAAYTAKLVDNMVQVLLEKSVDPKEITTGRKVANFLSTTFANVLTNLIFCGSQGSVLDSSKVGELHLLSVNEPTGGCQFDFRSQVPDIDADNLAGIVEPNPVIPDTAFRDEQKMREFWTEVCTNRLPLLYAWQNGNYVQTFQGLNLEELKKGSIVGYPIVSNWTFKPERTGSSANSAVTWVAVGGSGGGNSYTIPYLPPRPLLLKGVAAAYEQGLVAKSEQYKVDDPGYYVLVPQRNDNKQITGFELGTATQSQIEAADIEDSFYYFDYANSFAGYEDPQNPGRFSLQKMIENPLNMKLFGYKGTVEYLADPDLDENEAGQPRHAFFDTIVYEYIWQLHEEDSSRKLSEGYQSYAKGREYAMNGQGLPKGSDIAASSRWSPTYWPYFTDSTGRNYQLTFGGSSETALSVPNGAAIILTNPYGNAANLGSATVYKVSGQEAGGEVLGNLTQINFQDIQVYQYQGQLLAVWLPSRDLAGLQSAKMWKIDKSVSVVIDDDKVVAKNTSGLRGDLGAQLDVIEYIDRGSRQRKVLAAEALAPHKPCRAEPYGPPIDANDLDTKFSASEAILPQLWRHVITQIFIQQNKLNN